LLRTSIRFTSTIGLRTTITAGSSPTTISEWSGESEIFLRALRKLAIPKHEQSCCVAQVTLPDRRLAGRKHNGDMPWRKRPGNHRRCLIGSTKRRTLTRFSRYSPVPRTRSSCQRWAFQSRMPLPSARADADLIHGTGRRWRNWSVSQTGKYPQHCAHPRQRTRRMRQPEKRWCKSGPPPQSHPFAKTAKGRATRERPPKIGLLRGPLTDHRG
jgi:hypothetical protein